MPYSTSGSVLTALLDIKVCAHLQAFVSVLIALTHLESKRLHASCCVCHDAILKLAWMNMWLPAEVVDDAAACA
jgi:hypothetical protein